ncbi:epimerase [Leptospira perolatii]|uniref:Epimerase n=1 Tax=Leptospira perolatii TaxID=2023191 RepID=A0A2M9ZLY2_9LEPT|nr:NAD(P)-dependent oxidoreductase [Leptospira perolatii]PJZ69748.1 epimerase [Leptospira perolatii]PJZ73037.1 epimerase [Leptospira perolatii]
MKIFVTGATGFLGKRVIRKFITVGGHKLYGLCRSESSAEKLKEMGVTPVIGDLDSISELQPFLKAEGIEAIIHLAAEIATQRSSKKLWKTNHEGTNRLLEIAKTLPNLKRFIFASTVVVGESEGKVLTETDSLNVETEYGKTKQASEKVLLEAFRSSKFPVIILRPSHVYGAGGWFSDLMKDMKIGLFRIPGNGENFWDVVHVDDVSSAIVHLLKSGTIGEIYHVVDDTPVTMNDFFQEAGAYIGKKKVGHAPVFLANLLKGKDPVRAATRSARSSNAKIKKTGWKPDYPNYKLGLKQVFQELRK